MNSNNSTDNYCTNTLNISSKKEESKDSLDYPLFCDISNFTVKVNVKNKQLRSCSVSKNVLREEVSTSELSSSSPNHKDIKSPQMLNLKIPLINCICKNDGQIAVKNSHLRRSSKIHSKNKNKTQKMNFIIKYLNEQANDYTECNLVPHASAMNKTTKYR